MHFHDFRHPVIRTLFAWISIACLRLAGWRLEGKFTICRKYVMIAAPHTSNWDFPVTLGICFAARAKIYWMGKSSLFKGPLGPVMRWLGGVPVDRSKSNNLVQQMVDVFNRSEQLVLTISAGRHACQGAANEIRLLSHRGGHRCRSCWRSWFPPQGGDSARYSIQPANVEQDMAAIQAFLQDIVGRTPTRNRAAARSPASSAATISRPA